MRYILPPFCPFGYVVALSNTMDLESHPSSRTMLGAPQNATEIEERKRTYWLVLVLDRFISIGGHRRPLQTRESGLDKPLPCDDTLFYAGVSDFYSFTAVNPIVLISW